MNATESNAVRRLARKCWGDVESAWKNEGARNAQERKEIYLRILSKYETKYHPIYTRRQLIYWMGVANGTLEDRH